MSETPSQHQVKKEHTKNPLEIKLTRREVLEDAFRGLAIAAARAVAPETSTPLKIQATSTTQAPNTQSNGSKTFLPHLSTHDNPPGKPPEIPPAPVEVVKPSEVKTGSELEGKVSSWELVSLNTPKLELESKEHNIKLVLEKHVAFAINSLKVKDKELVDGLNLDDHEKGKPTADHGRSIQTALQNGSGEVINPTECGSADDGFKPTTTSEVLEVRKFTNPTSGDQSYYVKLHPAHWQPLILSEDRESGQYKEKKVSDDVFETIITLRKDGVIVVDKNITFSKETLKGQFVAVELLTGYLQSSYDQVYTRVHNQTLALNREFTVGLNPTIPMVHTAQRDWLAFMNKELTVGMGVVTDDTSGFRIHRSGGKHCFKYFGVAEWTAGVKWSDWVIDYSKPKSMRYRDYLVTGDLNAINNSMNSLQAEFGTNANSTPLIDATSSTPTRHTTELDEKRRLNVVVMNK